MKSKEATRGRKRGGGTVRKKRSGATPNQQHARSARTEAARATLRRLFEGLDAELDRDGLADGALEDIATIGFMLSSRRDADFNRYPVHLSSLVARELDFARERNASFWMPLVADVVGALAGRREHGRTVVAMETDALLLDARRVALRAIWGAEARLNALMEGRTESGADAYLTAITAPLHDDTAKRVGVLAELSRALASPFGLEAGAQMALSELAEIDSAFAKLDAKALQEQLARVAKAPARGRKAYSLSKAAGELSFMAGFLGDDQARATGPGGRTLPAERAAKAFDQAAARFSKAKGPRLETISVPGTNRLAQVSKRTPTK